MTRIAVLVSGGGTNLKALIDAEREGRIPGGKIALVISSKEGAYALERARDNNIPAVTIIRKGKSVEEFDEAVFTELGRHDIGLVVLAGFLSVLGPKMTEAYAGRMLNIHPALIPSFSGKGFYGLRVHEAVLAAGVKVTGATVHFVSDVVDGGRIVLQKAVDVLADDTAETLQKRVMEEVEQVILPKAVAMFCAGEIEDTQVGCMARDRSDTPAR